MLCFVSLAAVISVVLINQFAGPVMCKYALRKFGEAGKMTDEGEEHDEHGGPRMPKKLKRALLFGIDSTSLAVAARLLKAGWRVSCIDSRRENLILAKSLGIPKEHTNSCLDGGDHTLFPSPWTVVPTLPLDPMPDSTDSGAPGAGLHHESTYREHRGPVIFHDGSGSFGSSSYDPHAPGSEATSFGPGPWEPLLDMVLAPPQNVTHANMPAAGAASTGAAASASSASASSAPASSSTPAPRSSDAGLNTTGGSTHSFSSHSSEEAAAAQTMGHYIESVGDMDCGGVEACILSLPSDQSNYELGVWLMRARRAPRVLVRVINPTWTDTFREQGLLPVTELASTSAVLSAGAQSRGNLLVVSSTLPLHDALHSLISPVEDTNHLLLPLSGHERLEWEHAHPGPSSQSFDSLVRHLRESGVEFGVNDRDDVHALSLDDLRTGRIEFLERMHSVNAAAIKVLSAEDEMRNEEIGMGISAHGLNDARRAEERKAAEEERKQEEETELMISQGKSPASRNRSSSTSQSNNPSEPFSFSPRGGRA